MTNKIINIKYKRLMTQKKKNQNEQEVNPKLLNPKGNQVRKKSIFKK